MKDTYVIRNFNTNAMLHPNIFATSQISPPYPNNLPQSQINPSYPNNLAQPIISPQYPNDHSTIMSISKS